MQGTTLTATVSRGSAVWTSGWGRAHPGRSSILVGLYAADSSYLPGLEASYDEFIVQVRRPGHHWKNDTGLGAPQPYTGLAGFMTDLSFENDADAGRYVHYRVLFRASVSGTYSEKFKLSIRVGTSARR